MKMFLLMMSALFSLNLFALDPVANFNRLERQQQLRDKREAQSDYIQRSIRDIEQECGPIAMSRNGRLEYRISDGIFYANLQGGGSAHIAGLGYQNTWGRKAICVGR